MATKKKKPLAEDVVESKSVPVLPEDEELLRRLFEYTQPKAIPFYNDYMNVVRECYNFKERRQWEGADMQALASIDVPVVSVDRISRSLDTINGIRTNTGSKKKIVKRELGDDRVAQIIDKVADFDDYNGDFASSRGEAFDGMLDVGLGVRKIGYDPQEMGGEGMIFAEFCNTEDVGYSRCKKKTLEDIVWGWHRTMMNWEEAILINPEKAPQLKSLQTTLESKWEELKSGNVKSNFLTKDYSSEVGTQAENKYEYNGQVYVYEFWQKKVIPVKKIGSIAFQPIMDEAGNSVGMQPVPQVRLEAHDYVLQGSEQVLAFTTQIEWCQYIAASGRGQTSSILLKESKSDDHPFVGMCAERRKNQMPTGFIEKVIDHQKRINIAWAQKTAYNNKSIKSPLIVKGKIDLETAIQQSSFGAILTLDQNSDIVQVNTTPNVNLQAIEEGNVARQDMDFAAAASEPVMRGQVGSSTSGIQMAQQQNAAITPLNKWVKAEQESELLFWRKWLKLALRYYTPQRMARVVGEQAFMKIVSPQFNPMTGQMILPALELPFDASIEKYDVIIQDQSLSDFNKQQTFNSVIAMKQSGILFDDEFVITSAPIKDIDGAIASNQKARQDMLMMLMQENEMLKEQLMVTEKLVPKENKGKPNRAKSQPANAQSGKNASQAGSRSMVGGQLGISK